MKTQAKRALNLKASLFSHSQVGPGRRQMPQIASLTSSDPFPNVLLPSQQQSAVVWREHKGQGTLMFMTKSFSQSLSSCLLLLLPPAPQNANAGTGTQSTQGSIEFHGELHESYQELWVITEGLEFAQSQLHWSWIPEPVSLEVAWFIYNTSLVAV